VSHVEDLPVVSVHAGRFVVKTIVVTAAIIQKDDRYLVTRRQAGTHLAGVWEFPGGKCDDGESLTACMARELREELGIEATVGAEIFTTAHEYPDRTVELHFFACQSAQHPSPLLGQEMRWVARSELGNLEFPPADAELIRVLTDGL
jgi:8-oxo-dGTP diphosphatase